MLSTLSEKIDFLMTLTATRSSTLARALNYDPSYISRIRSGKRGIPTHQPFLEPASLYFAKAIKKEHQKNAAANAMQLQAAWPKDEKKAAKQIEAWLKGETIAEDPLARVTASLRGAKKDARKAENAREKSEALLFFGNEGKREGVRILLEDLVQSGKPCTLLLHSDENMDWLTEDAAFAKVWAGLLLQLVQNGGRIRIIHSIGRQLNEMWEAVKKWLPLYMTGAIEPYYYPLLRDGVYLRTTFIAAGHSAFVSNSVKGQKGDPLSFLITDPHAIRALEQEFAAFLAQCKPLMEVAHIAEEKELKKLKKDFLGSSDEVKTLAADGIEILIAESTSALVLKTRPPYTAFAIREPRLMAALGEYIRSGGR